VQTYEAIASDANTTLGRVSRWLLVAYTISNTGYIGSFYSPTMRGRIYVGSWIPDLLGLFGKSPIGLVCVVLLNILLSYASFIFANSILHWISRKFRGTGTFSTFAFTQAAHIVPIIILNTLIIAFRPIAAFSSILAVYNVVLYAVTIKAVHKIDWSRVFVITISGVFLNLIWVAIFAAVFGSTQL
jgi:hypothetical protein